MLYSAARRRTQMMGRRRGPLQNAFTPAPPVEPRMGINPVGAGKVGNKLGVANPPADAVGGVGGRLHNGTMPSQNAAEMHYGVMPVNPALPERRRLM